jgi:NADP-dependent 3-hydroxy acid dehydrogenase YdfG
MNSGFATYRITMTVYQPIENYVDPLAGTTAIVTGVSRGFGRAIAAALADAGAHVVGVARGSAQL